MTLKYLVNVKEKEQNPKKMLNKDGGG